MRLIDRGQRLPAAEALVTVLLTRLPALVARVRAVSSATTLTAATAFAMVSASSCRWFLSGVHRVVHEGAVTSLPLTAVFSEPTLPRRTVFVTTSARRLGSLLGSAGILRWSMRTSLHHKMHHGQPMMVLRVVSLMAKGTSSTSHLEVGHALR